MSKIKLTIEMDEDEYKRVKNAECSYDGYEKGTFGYYLNIIQKTATPITESDDCVSRQAVIDALKDGTKECIVATRTREMRLDIVGVIEALPFVTPKREQGEWICDDFIESIYHCSLCQGKIKGKLSKYCPNCGAEMR